MPQFWKNTRAPFLYRVKRTITVSMVFALLFLLTSGVHATPWTNKYVHRPKKSLDLPTSMGLMSSATRQVINLNGVWQARKKGEKNWEQVIVPGAYDFAGEVEFKHYFRIDTNLVRQTFKLVALGINARSAIYINDNYVGGHDGGHTPFSMDLENHHLNFEGQNEIRILVDNRLHPRHSLPLKHRPRLAHNYGGIFRDIFIISSPPISIENLLVETNFGHNLKNPQVLVSAILKSKVKPIENDKENLALQVELWDSDGEKLVSQSSKESIYFDTVLLRKEITLTVNEAKLWNPDQPNLYNLRAFLTRGDLVLDEWSLKIGLCDLKVEGKNLLLNGQPVVIQGMDWYEDYSDLGPTAGWEEIKAELTKIKELGTHAIRVVGTPPHPFLLDICDQLGILVFLELPLYSIPEHRFRDRAFTQLVQNYYHEILESHAYHVSLAAWGLGCDLQFEKPNTKNFLQNLKQKIQKYTSRPIYSVFRYDQQVIWPRTADFVLLDCFNKEAEETLTIVQQWSADYPNKPFIVSIGHPLPTLVSKWHSFNLVNNKRTMVSNEGDRLIETEEVQADQIQRAIATLKLFPDLAGKFIYSYADWIEARPNLIVGPPGIPFLHKSGIVSQGRQRRLAYDVVYSEFRGDKPPTISSRDKTNQNPIVYPVAGLTLVLIFLFNFNRSRRLRKNLRRIFIHPHGFYLELRENRKVPGWHTFLLGFLTCAVLSIMISSTAFLLRLNLLFDEVLNLLIVNDSLKLKLIWLIWQPFWFILIVTGIFFLIFNVTAFLLKFTAIALGLRLPTSQFFTLTSWAGANFVWLLPVAPIYYRILLQPHWFAPAIWILVLFLGWFWMRMFRGIKVLYSLSYFQTGIMVFIFCLLVFGGLGWYYDRNHALFDYWPYYWNLMAR